MEPHVVRMHETPRLFGSALAGEIVAPAEILPLSSQCNASANVTSQHTCDASVSGNQLPQLVSSSIKILRLEREESTRHGQTDAPEVHPPASQTPTTIGGCGIGGDRLGMGPQRGRIAAPHHVAALDGPGTHRPLSDTAAIIRDQRRRDLIAAIAEWERASGPDRVWWRRDARHRLAEWRRLYRQPERAAFQQAVARSKARRKRCIDCRVNWADPPSPLCPGCEAYREHQA